MDTNARLDKGAARVQDPLRRPTTRLKPSIPAYTDRRTPSPSGVLAVLELFSCRCLPLMGAASPSLEDFWVRGGLCWLIGGHGDRAGVCMGIVIDERGGRWYCWW